MKIPTNTRAGAVAMCGIIKNNGDKKRHAINNIPTTTAVRPVRPPSAIPVVLSAPSSQNMH